VSASGSDKSEKVAILDIDGTLVDTNYQHAIAWYRAFRQHGIVLPVWRIHRHIGMGGDQVVAALTDEQTEREQGDEIRATESDVYKELIGEVETMEASRELIEQLKRRGHTVILASSAKDWEVDHYLDLLDARELADDWTTSADVQATKPEPDLVNAALKRAGQDGRDAVMVGDTPWDVRAASNAGVPTVAVLTGGFAIEELKESGAEAVFESVAELCSRLGQTSLG
jgi:HAD superfamily hydrolase (TIGR01509 family)